IIHIDHLKIRHVFEQIERVLVARPLLQNIDRRHLLSVLRLVNRDDRTQLLELERGDLELQRGYFLFERCHLLFELGRIVSRRGPWCRSRLCCRLLFVLGLRFRLRLLLFLGLRLLLLLGFRLLLLLGFRLLLFLGLRLLLFLGLRLLLLLGLRLLLLLGFSLG